MYLAELKLWNFRKYSEEEIEGQIFGRPGLEVQFNPRLNILIGENDSGKTAIIDSIKYILKTKSLDSFWIDERDFFEDSSGNRSDQLKIECIFRGFTNEEAGSFIEWIGFDDSKNFELKVWLIANRRDQTIQTKFKAGADDEGTQLDGDAREGLKAIYLKPLRDALAELTPGYRSRLAQILKGHEIFKDEKDASGNRIEHKLEEKVKIANAQISSFFDIGGDESNPEQRGKKITEEVKSYLDSFSFDNVDNNPQFLMSKGELSEILKSLSLVLESNKSGLGSLNKLYMAAEFLLLNQASDRGLKLAIIEEIEAHLHPQAQLQIISTLQDKATYDGQMILTTHSTTLVSKVKLDHIILCKNNEVYPMFRGKTKLLKGDYGFLERFLDDTKANLFFARGVIFVEGDSENLLIPTLAKIIERPLHKYGVSIVNVGSTAFLRYSKIFQRLDGKELRIPVSIITDLDIPSIEFYIDGGNQKEKKVYVLNDSNIEGFKDITKHVEFDNLKGVYTSVKNFNDAISEFKTVERFPKGIRKQLEEKIKSIEKDADEDEIKALREMMLPLKTSKYSDGLIMGYVAQNWTLEYELALSNIREVLYQSILESLRIQQDNNLIIDVDDITDIQAQVQIFFQEQSSNSQEAIAYEIFKPINNGRVSKAILAQRLAHNLSLGDFKDAIKSSAELSYLKDAIYHVTKPE